MWKSGYRAALVGLALSACGFPQVSIEQTSSSTSVTSSSSGPGAGGGAGGVTSTTSGTGGNGETGGTGGNSETGGAGGGGNGGCSPGDCSQGVDKDHDGHADKLCAEGGGGAGSGLPQDDCDDCDERVFPGQTQFFGERQPRVGYDYNCSGVEEKRYQSAICSGLLICGQANIFLSSSPIVCGVTHEFGDCAPGLACSFIPDEARQQTCH